jgi:glycosyltransferase involved in cell wall biosynthesis
MRICSIITSFTSGGAEVLVGTLAQAFVAAGHDAMILSLSNAVDVGNSGESERAIMTGLRGQDVAAGSLGLTNRNDWIRGGRALRHVLNEFRPDVIHAHTARALPLIALSGSRASVVLTHHNSRLPFPAWLFRLFDWSVGGYVAISDECEALIGRHARRPIRKIMNAAGAHFLAGAPRDAPATNPVILAVGTVSVQKDYQTLIRAARPLADRLSAQGRRPRFRIAGGGPMLSDLHDLVAREGATGFVEVLGVRNDVDTLMRDADMFVNSSLWEGFSIAMIEATMSGLPIVATDVAGNREMVLPGANGYLVPPSDPVALADAIAETVSDVARYALLSCGALMSAGRFSIETCAQLHLSLYQDLVEPRSAIAHVPTPIGRNRGIARPTRPALLRRRHR